MIAGINDQDDRQRIAQRMAREHVLAAIAASPAARHLVLRGSALLPAWLGEAAREPGDLDFVVTPSAMSMHGAESAALLDGIIAAVATRAADAVHVDTTRVRQFEIYTYERAAGRRMLFSWHTPDRLRGQVQVDVVYNEYLLDPAIETAIPIAGGMWAATMLTVSPRLSLAWKILWLETDQDAQFKDLYDAVLLAEFTTLPLALLRDVLEEIGDEAHGFGPHRYNEWEFDWHNWRTTDPWLPVTPHSLLTRLEIALAKTFEA